MNLMNTFEIRERSNIIIIGTLSSGSSALVDMLKEYENIYILPTEFDDYRRPGLVSDQLSFHTSRDYPNVIDNELGFENKKWKLIYKTSIWKLFSGPYLKKVWDKEWKPGKLSAYKRSLYRLYKIYFLEELNKSLKSEISFEEKIRLSNEWINRIGSIYPSQYDYILFNQPLFPWFDPEIWTKVFRPFKLICVHRDPKDQLAEMIRRNIVFDPFGFAQLSYAQFNITSIYGRDRKGRMKFLMDALKKRLETIDQWIKVLGRDQMLLIDFEGLANNYDLYKSDIEKFLGLNNEKHTCKKLYFNPEIALKNSLGIYKNYLNEEEIEDLSDLESWYNNKVQSMNHY